MAVILEIIDLLVCRKIHGCGCFADDPAPRESNHWATNGAGRTAWLRGRVRIHNLSTISSSSTWLKGAFSSTGLSYIMVAPRRTRYHKYARVGVKLA